MCVSRNRLHILQDLMASRESPRCVSTHIKPRCTTCTLTETDVLASPLRLDSSLAWQQFIVLLTVRPLPP